MHKNLTGSTTIVFHHCQLKGKTPIHDNEGNIVQMITGFDANVLYLRCTGFNMPMGKPRIYWYNAASKKMELLFDPGIRKNKIPGWLVCVATNTLTCIMWSRMMNIALGHAI